MRLAVRGIVGEALESEVRKLLGRDYCEHRQEAGGYRSGNRPGRMPTREGEVTCGSPRMREHEGAESAELCQALRVRTEALEDPAVGVYAPDLRRAVGKRSCATRRAARRFRGAP